MTRSWLKSKRVLCGMRQDDVAKRVGVTQSAYCQIENGVKTPSVDTAKKIANELNFNWTRFFDEGSENS